MEPDPRPQGLHGAAGGAGLGGALVAGGCLLDLIFFPNLSPFTPLSLNLCAKIGLNTNLRYQGDRLSEGQEDPGLQVTI